MAKTPFTVSSSRTINAGIDAIRPWIVDFHRWEQWSPWEKLDPGMRHDYSGPESGEGARMAWSGNRKAGEGVMTIRSVSEDNVMIDLEFIKPFRDKNITRFSLAPEGEGTVVEWSMNGEQGLLMRIMGKLMSMDQRIAKDFDEGLAALARCVESNPAGSDERPK
jgi:hypothetical protein